MERVNREHKEKIMEMIKKAGDPNNYETSWDEKGIAHINKYKPNIERGEKSRVKGTNFELKVRKNLESKGRFVDKWTNNVDLKKGEIIISRKYNPFKKMIVLGTGFPDFISVKHVHDELYSVIGVEVKVNGILSKEEKEKCAFYLQKRVFSHIWIAKAVNNGRRVDIEYDDFQEKYGDKYNKP